MKLYGFLLFICLCSKGMSVKAGEGETPVWNQKKAAHKICQDYNILDTSRYLSLQEHYDFLDNISLLANNTLNVKVIGNTFIEGKDVQHDIHLVTIGSTKDPVIFFDCGIHAREWVSTPTCLFVIQRLACMFEMKDIKKSKNSIFNYQWQFIPMLNPDGYNISFYGDRMFRKNGRPYTSMNLTKVQLAACRCDKDPESCRGVDLNRNLPSGWGLGNERFSRESGLPCFEMYRGSHPISEPETKILDAHISSLGNQVIGAFSIHSYGQEIYHPKGWLVSTADDQIKGPELDLLKEFANSFNKQIKFGVGNVESLLGGSDLEGGTTEDYYYTEKHINVTYTIELDPNLDEDHIGFELPAEKLFGLGQKMVHVVQLMADKFDELYPR